ncbi:MAG: hypothetical protein UT30_C0048G0005 [Candidatus Uhrbacteria bacterium GW2011_GWF2_39_13]|uniref:Peptidase C39-like domain-containing protein n=1 Tax=Candidatus Uhrbacteria bacterium GW2011_GWF2_39_13 TaxID=1618995 RepID=A0A0G0PXF6_9BACT|nr:MAG: hypothetical protein UT30_C0048G0005 [Candidatus Uhrbacteria bacterium GW2011_GWF2_39_13]
MKKFFMLCVLSISIFLACGFTVKADSRQFSSARDNAILIADNLDGVNMYYSLNGYDNKIKSYSLHKMKITTKTGVELGYCIDFDADNGYMIVGEDAIYDVAFKGYSFFDLEVNGTVEYNVYDGFLLSESLLRVEIQGEEIKVLSDESDIIGNTSYESSIDYSVYNGTVGGVITDLYDYATDRYSATFDYAINISSFSYGSMEDLSVYFLNGNTEGNCGLVAAYYYLSWARNKYYMMLIPSNSYMTLYEPAYEETSLFYQRLSMGTYEIRSNLDGDPNTSATDFRPLYFATRKEGLSVNNNSPDSWVLTETELIVENIAHDYGYAFINIGTTNVALSTLIMNKINAGLAGMMAVAFHPTYGNHFVYVEGYEVYEKTEFIPLLNIYIIYEYVFLQIRDGWNNTSRRYYDINDFFLTGYQTQFVGC